MQVDDMIQDILRREGGYVNLEQDRGGPTNHGVRQATLSQWLGRPASIDDVKALTEAEAARIYRVNYFEKPGLDLLPEAIQPQVFDMSINHGPNRAIRLLQKTLNSVKCMVGGKDISEDGVIGPETIEAARACLQGTGAEYLNRALAEVRMQFYKAIVRRDPSQKVFLKGWLRRAREFQVSL